MKIELNNKQAGFSLIELMIALVIGLVILAAVVEVVFGSLILFRTQSGLGKLQENARFATSFISQDVRSSSYLGCDINATNKNIIADSTNNTPNNLDYYEGIDGLNNVGTSTTFGSFTATTGTDVLQLRFAQPSNACEISTHDADTNTFTCDSDHSFVQNQPLIVSDCSHSAIFLKSNPLSAATPRIIEHSQTANDPKNCTNNLGPSSQASNTANPCNTTFYQFKTGNILPLQSISYFISQNDLNQPALYRQTTDLFISSALNTNVREIVEGVEDMQILYGEDTDSDNIVNHYVTIDQIADNDNIVSIRLNLLLRSIEDNIVDTDTGQTYNFYNQSTTQNDGRLRRVITSTIALRNRL